MLPRDAASSSTRLNSARHAGWLVALGLFPAVAYPPLEWASAAWLALAPAIWLLARGPGGAAPWLGMGCGYGLAHAAVQYRWLPEALWVKGGLPFPVFLGFSLTLLGVAALYPAAAFALGRWAALRWGLSPYATFPVAYALQDALLGVTPFGGAPWGSLAATQTGTWAAAALVPVLGGSGLALALAGVNAGWGAAFDWAWRGQGSPRRWLPLAAMAGLTLLCAWPTRPGGANDPGSALAFRALMIPGDLPLAFLADPGQAQAGLRHFTGKTLGALSRPETGTAGAMQRGTGEEGTARPLLAVWPESAVPGEAARGKLLADLHSLTVALDTDFLFGSNGRALGRIHNSAYLVTGERFATIRYDKRRLVPFGEYVPVGFRALFGKKLTAGVQDYSPGQAPPVLEWHGLRLGLAICFESILPAHAREAAAAGAEALISLSNAAWFSPAASRHHLHLSALRALETGRDLLLVANGGWSALIRDGRIALALPPGGDPALAVLHRRRGLTPWVRWGYLPLLAAAAAWLALAIAWRAWGDGGRMNTSLLGAGTASREAGHG